MICKHLYHVNELTRFDYRDAQNTGWRPLLTGNQEYHNATLLICPSSPLSPSVSQALSQLL